MLLVSSLRMTSALSYLGKPQIRVYRAVLSVLYSAHSRYQFSSGCRSANAGEFQAYQLLLGPFQAHIATTVSIPGISKASWIMKGVLSSLNTCVV